MSASDDRSLSATSETALYRATAPMLHKKCFQDLCLLFDQVAEMTHGFTVVTPECLLRDPTCLRILRYAVAPSLSQMKFEQEFGIKDISKLESGVRPKSVMLLLAVSAKAICDFINDQLDEEKFPWVRQQRREPSASELKMARLWTAGLIADQATQTAYRNWRKERQELAIKINLEALGYRELTEAKKYVQSINDVPAGFFRRETKVLGDSLQKADIVVGSRKNNSLLLIEAKAIGVAIDAYKRVKECCDKSRDWKKNPNLSGAGVVACVAGFLSETNLETLAKANVGLVWEHRLEDLKEYV